MKMEQLLKPKIILVFGRICSGKGHYGKDPIENARIVVSDIVRSLVKSSDRNVLQNSLSFDKAIADQILEKIRYYEKMNLWYSIIVDGVRQITIVEKILEHYPEAEMVWLEVPTEERKRRYENRQDKRDIEPFEVADNKPIELECQKIFDTLKDRLTIINNY